MDYGEYEQNDSGFDSEVKYNAEIEFLVEQLNYMAHAAGRYSRSVQVPRAFYILEKLKEMNLKNNSSQELAVEFGYKQAEKGENLQAALKNFNSLKKP